MTDGFCIPPRRKTTELVAQLQQPIVQVLPFWIGFWDEADFPRALPFFNRFLARDRRSHIITGFIPHQFVDTVPLCEAFGLIVFMLPNPLGKSDFTPTYNVPFRLLARIYTQGCFMGHGGTRGRSPQVNQRW